MKCFGAKSRILVVLLVLHMAHAPFPIWDGDDVVTCCKDERFVENTDPKQSPVEPEENDLDLDIPLSFRTSREGFPRFWRPDFAEVEAVWQLWVVGATPWQGLVALRAFAALTPQATDFTAGLC